MQRRFNVHQETITVPIRGTGSFCPLGIAQTPYVGFQLIKESDKNSLDSLFLYVSNFRTDIGGGDGSSIQNRSTVSLWPSGSDMEYLWAEEVSFREQTSGTLASAPFLTGSSSGSQVYSVWNIDSEWARLTLRSNSGGRFTLIARGKE